MSSHASAARDGERAAKTAKDSDALRHAVRGGLIAYGVVHLLIGWLSIQLAFGKSSGSADNQGALRELAQTPIGRPLLWLVVIGFVALVLWQAVEAAVGHDDERDERTRAGKRAASAAKAVVYAVIAVSAAKIATGGNSGGGGSTEETWTAKLMGAPAGQVLVALVGLAIAAVGVFLIRKGWTETFRRQLEAGATGGQVGSAIVTVGKVGHVAKGAAFVILGVLFVLAAVEHDPDKSGGLDDALRTLLDQPYGQVLLPITGVGIGCFGLYCFDRARYVRT